MPQLPSLGTKNAGCDYMMCGTHTHGSILQAIRNGGCGHQFFWSSLKPASTFYIGINGERRSGAISEEYRMQATEKGILVSRLLWL